MSRITFIAAVAGSILLSGTAYAQDSSPTTGYSGSRMFHSWKLR